MSGPDMNRHAACPSLSFLPDVEGADKDVSVSAQESLSKALAEGESLAEGVDVESVYGYVGQNTDVPIVVVASELCPWSKSGGLAIVAAAYAYNFAQRGHRTMAIAPMYDDYEGAFYQCSKSFELFGCMHEVRYFHHWQGYGEGKGCDYVFIDHPCFRRPGGLYHDTASNQEYEDNLFRFALFSLAALEVPVGIELGGSPRYGGKCVFIANDWQTGLVPVYMQHRHRANGNYNEARCLYVIHNLGYQGCYPLRLGIPPVQYDNFGQLGLPFCALGELVYQYPEWERTYEGDTGETLNLTKGAIICADRILTVSQGYCDETKTPEGGFRLNGWLAEMDKVRMPHSKVCSLVKILADPVTVRQWNIDGLPADNFSVENGIIMSSTKRWPLMVDPQGQANRFIKLSQAKAQVKTCKASDSAKRVQQTLEMCIRLGNPMLLENVLELLDPSLEPILACQTYKDASGSLVIKLGDNIIPYHHDFKFSLTTVIPNPHYAPEVSVKVEIGRAHV